MADTPRKNLIVLLADRNAESAVRGLLSRSKSLGTKELRDDSYDVHVHPERDSGCLLRAAAFLRSFSDAYRYALVMFDREGCGREGQTAEVLEANVRDRLSRSGWQDRARVIVLDPELDAWVWSESPHVDSILGWRGRKPDLRSWLAQEEFLPPGQAKPKRPKEAMEAALNEVRKPRTSSIYGDLARIVSLGRCRDPAFLKLKSVLRQWFPPGAR